MPITLTGGGTVTGNVSFANSVSIVGNTTLTGPVTFSSNTVTIGGNSLSPFGGKNRIINGDMRIDQRNSGASQTVSSSGIYSVDRWLTGYVGSSSKYSIQQNAGSVTPPPGFSNYLGVTSLSAFTAATGDIYHFQQRIEGYNFSDLAYGTASAKTITVSFWARSSLTGLYNIQLFNPNGTQVRSYVATYTINAANTWEYKTITVPGDTSYAAADSTNGLAMILSFIFDGGATTYTTSTTNTWFNGNILRASGTNNLLATNGATLYITGVQLEEGSNATPFERRHFTTELALCQRYCYRYSADGTIDDYAVIGTGRYYGTNAAQLYIKFPVTMRYPASSVTVGGTIVVNDLGFTPATYSSPALNERSYDGATLTGSTTTGVTAGYATTFYASGATNAYIIFNAEM